MAKAKVAPKRIAALYDQIPRLSQERSDFMLAQIVDFVKSKGWINIRPEYQRRLVWDRKKKSRFIESLLMNIPIPPIFLYEHELSRYEVMDGQQRVNTILEFYENALKLTGLATWSALNGLTRKDCPEKIRRGLDRRRLSATVLLAESGGSSEEEAFRLRQEVFERLNTGGQKLNAQEMRNSMYAGLFNDLLIELAGTDLFDDIWSIPRYDDHYDRVTGEISSALSQNALFKRMIDCEIVLRFFAFRESEHIRGSVKSILDGCMKRNQNLRPVAISEHREAFLRALRLARRIFRERVFQVKNRRGRWATSQPLFDAVMVSLDRLSAEARALIEAREAIQARLHDAIQDDGNYEIIVGKPNTAKAVKQRINLVYSLIKDSL